MASWELRDKIGHRLIACSIVMLLCQCTTYERTLSDKQRQERVDESKKEINFNEGYNHEPVSIYDAISRAIKYNYDLRIKALETTLAKKDLTSTSVEMLPDIVAQAGYQARSNEAGGRSQSLLTGQTSLEFSRSSEKYSRTADLTASWNILDLGISYFNAKEKANAVLISEAQKEALMQDIIRDVWISYWKAKIADNYASDVKELLKRSRESLARSIEAEKKGLIGPEESLRYQHNVLDTIRELEELLDQLVVPKIELAALIHLRPNANFMLATPLSELTRLPTLSGAIDSFEEYALLHRPELQEQDYQVRSQIWEIRKQWYQLLPSLVLETSRNYDDNVFLFHNTWGTAGAKIFMDVLKPIKQGSKVSSAHAQMDIVKARRNALSIAILSQVNIAYQQLHESKDHAALLEELKETDKKIYSKSKQTMQAGLLNPQLLLQDEAKYLFSRVKTDLAHVDVQSNQAKLLRSMGYSILEREDIALEETALTERIEERLTSLSQLAANKQGMPMQISPASH